MTLLFDNDDENLGGDGAPDLRLHGILAVAQKVLDALVLLDPFEEQLHLPTILVKLRDDRCRQRRVVGQKNQGLSDFRVFESHPAQVPWVIAGSLEPIEFTGQW